jgi:lysophospholipase L1-like esterase
MLADFLFDVCAGCGARELHRAKLRSVWEKLVSPILIPYRCHACAQRHFKLAKLRIAPAKRLVIKQAAASSAFSWTDHVSSAAFAKEPSFRRLAEPAVAVPAGSLEPVVSRVSAIAFLEPVGKAKQAVIAGPVGVAHPVPDLKEAEPPVPDKPGVRHYRVAVALRKIGRAFARIRKPALWAVVVVSGVELILQVAAVAVWFANRPQPRHLVLCVGDSYTFGTGATGSEFSYPSALERLLQKDDRSWQVVNAGWPDQDSRDTVLTLPDQLLHFHPSRVYIAIGAMDALTQPKAVSPGTEKAVSYDFPLVWRTPLLYEQLLGGANSLAEKTAVDYTAFVRYVKFRMNRSAGPSPTGTWLYGGQLLVRIQDNGRITFGKTELFWDAHGDQLNTVPVIPGSAAAEQYQWKRRGKLLMIKGGLFPQGIVLQPVGPEEARRLDAAAAPETEMKPEAVVPSATTESSLDKQAQQEKNLESALSKTKPSQRFFLRSELTRIYARDGKRGEARGELEKMRQDMDAAGDSEPMVDKYIDSAETIGEGARALAAAREFALRYTGNALLQKTIAWESYQNRDTDSATVAIDKALQLESNSNARAGILNMRAQIFLDTNVPKSLESLIEAYAITGDEFTLRRQLDRGLVLYNPELLELTFEKMKASFELRQGIRRAINGLERRPYGDIASVMAKNLRLMVEIVRATGSEVVFLSYPLAGDGKANDVLRRVANEKKVALIDLEAAFTKRLENTPREDLFAPDGHLTNKGYALIADLVAPDIRKRKQ